MESAFESRRHTNLSSATRNASSCGRQVNQVQPVPLHFPEYTSLGWVSWPVYAADMHEEKPSLTLRICGVAQTHRAAANS